MENEHPYRPETQKPPNPAKEALRGYRSLLRQREEVEREVEEHYARATSCTMRLKPYKAAGGAASYDRMAEDAMSAADARQELAALDEALAAELRRLREMLTWPETANQREVILRRYLRGQRWEAIAAAMCCDKVTAWRWHGDALVTINQRLAEEGHHEP